MSILSSESTILNTMQKRVVQSFLDVVILQELEKRALGGSDIISLVNNKFHMILSPGTVYSYLYGLERDGFVKGSYSSKTRVYSLTERGQGTAKVFTNHKDRILEMVSRLFTEK